MNEELIDTVATNAISNTFLAVSDSEQTPAFAARYLQITKKRHSTALDVAEIATKLGLLVLGR